MSIGIRILVAALAVMLPAAGCATRASAPVSPAPSSSRPVPADVAYLVDALRSGGLEASVTASAGTSGNFGERAAEYEISVNDGFLTACVPNGSLDTSSLASIVSSDGGSFTFSPGEVQFVNWAGKPRFYRDSDLVVLYVEGLSLGGGRIGTVSSATDRKVIAVLERLMGRPFAGGR